VDDIGVAVLFGVGFEHFLLIHDGIAIPKLLVISGQSFIKGGDPLVCTMLWKSALRLFSLQGRFGDGVIDGMVSTIRTRRPVILLVVHS
jgi:hypothetical protein